MAALRIRLDNDYSKGYTLIGISCHLKDYRLIYNINKELNFDFKKCDDLVIFPVKGKTKNSFSFYCHCDEFMEYNIIANRSPEGLLISEQKKIDYILVISGQAETKQIKAIQNSILKTSGVLTAFEININSVQNLDVILSDLELHLLKIKKEQLK